MIGLTSLACAIFYFRPDMPLPGLWSLAPAGGSALLIAFATTQDEMRQMAGRATVGRRRIGELQRLSLASATVRFRPLQVRRAGGRMADARLDRGCVRDGLGFMAIRRTSLSRSGAFFTRVGVSRGLGHRNNPHHSRQNYCPEPRVSNENAGHRRRNGRRRLPKQMPGRARFESESAGRNGRLPAGRPKDENRFPVDRRQPRRRSGRRNRCRGIAKGRRGLILAANACLPVLGLEGHIPRSKDACRRMHESLIECIDYFGVKLVLMHARWRAMDEDGVVSARDLKSKSPLQAVRDRLSETLSKFNAHGARVVIISDTPRAPFRVAIFWRENPCTNSISTNGHF